MTEIEVDPLPTSPGETAVSKVKARMAAEGEDWQTALAWLVDNDELD